MKNYYQVLGLNEDATQDEIKNAYKRYVVKFHPDKHNGDSFFKERFQEIQEAYDYLSQHYNENCSQESDTTYNNDFVDNIEDVDFSCSPISIKEGEILTLNWNTNANCSISITIDNGYSIQNFNNLDQTGSKKIKINRLNGNIIATLNCFNKSSSICKTIYIPKREEADIDSFIPNFSKKEDEEISENQVPPKSGCLYDFIIVATDLIAVIAIIILLEWLLYTYCSFNTYIMLALTFIIIWGCAAINGVILKKYFPFLGQRRRSPDKNNNIQNI